MDSLRGEWSLEKAGTRRGAPCRRAARESSCTFQYFRQVIRYVHPPLFAVTCDATQPRDNTACSAASPENVEKKFTGPA